MRQGSETSKALKLTLDLLHAAEQLWLLARLDLEASKREACRCACQGDTLELQDQNRQLALQEPKPLSLSCLVQPQRTSELLAV